MCIFLFPYILHIYYSYVHFFSFFFFFFLQLSLLKVLFCKKPKKKHVAKHYYIEIVLLDLAENGFFHSLPAIYVLVENNEPDYVRVLYGEKKKKTKQRINYPHLVYRRKRSKGEKNNSLISKEHISHEFTLVPGEFQDLCLALQ